MSEHKKCPVCRGEPFIKSSHDEDMCYWERVECRKCGLSTRGKWASDRSNACAIFREEVWAEWDDRAEPEQQAEPVAWQPMETCPEEGEFLVYIPSERPEKRMQVAQWRKNAKIIGHIFHFDSRPPTHWMPLPAAPKEQSEW